MFHLEDILPDNPLSFLYHTIFVGGTYPFSLVDKIDTNANSVDPDKTAHNEQSPQDLHCFSVFDCQLAYLSILNSGGIQIQIQKKSGVKGL